MLDPEKFLNDLIVCGIEFCVGVPDSTFSPFNKALEKYESRVSHIIAANEGNAIAIAAGYYLATKKVPLVYMQNSGLGNSLNPIISMN